MIHAKNARRMLRGHSYGALCTQSAKFAGYPFGSITPYMVDQDGSLIIHISALAEHTRNIESDARTSLITHNQNDPDIRMQGRVTVVGNAQKIGHQPRYLNYFPQSAHLATLDFSFYRILPVAIRYIGGVGRVHWIDMQQYAAPAFTEDALLRRIRELDLARAWLHRHHAVDVQRASIAGIDCDGLDIRASERIYRLDFARTLTEPLLPEELPDLGFVAP